MLDFQRLTRIIGSISNSIEPRCVQLVEFLTPQIIGFVSCVKEVIASLGPDFYLLAFIMVLQFRYMDKQFKTLRGTPAKEKATASTIAIMGRTRLSTDPPFAIGHGALTLCHERNRFGIFTAAHVINDVLEYRGQNKEIYIQSISGEHRYDVDIRSLDKFIGNEYWRKGERDFGVMDIRFINGPPKKWFKKLVISQDAAFDSELVGTSQNFRFRGEVFSIIDKWRVGLGIPSMPGCSGTPFFCPNGRLLAVLHGEWKHRGLRHSGSLNKDGFSNHVYVDMVKNLDGLHFWPDLYNDCLKCLEKLSEAEANAPGTYLSKQPPPSPQKPEPPQLLERIQIFFGVQPSSSDGSIHSDPLGLPLQFPSPAALELYEAAKRILPQSDACFNKEAHSTEYFTIEDVCVALMLHRRNNAGNHPKLKDRLVSAGKNTYWAVSFPELH